MPHRLKGSDEFEQKLCETLGIPADRVQRIIIDVQPGQPIECYVQMIGFPDELAKLDWPPLIETMLPKD